MKRLIAAGWMSAALVAGTGAAASGAPREVRLRGLVRDEAGVPLPDLDVKAFVDGFRREAAVTGPDGAYSVAFSFDEEADPTVVVWWIPREPGRVPELAILRESARARRLGIWSPCVPRLGVEEERVHDVVVCREAEKLRRLRASGCLEAGPSGP